MKIKIHSLPRLLPVSFIALLLCQLAAVAPMLGQSERKITQLADGVYEIQHPTNHVGFVSGNSTVIIGDRQVFVVDSCFLPSAAREDIAQIRQWTDKPVSFVLNTHFHIDHNIGNRTYMDAFPGLTVIAHVETKKQMDMFGPSAARRMGENSVRLQKMLDTGKTADGQTLTEDDKAEVKGAIGRQAAGLEELRKVDFQSATLTFDHDFTVDIGHREVQVKFLGRGNTDGDAVVYLPKEKIAIAGDLVVYPLPYIFDGYPTEWIRTLDNLARLDADTIVPGHGPVMHDKAHIYLIRDFIKSAVDQMNEKLRQTRPAMTQTLDDVKGSVDLASFRPRFAGTDKDLGDEFDNTASQLVRLVFLEASMR